jgi:hypothetical protein
LERRLFALSTDLQTLPLNYYPFLIDHIEYVDAFYRPVSSFSSLHGTIDLRWVCAAELPAHTCIISCPGNPETAHHFRVQDEGKEPWAVLVTDEKGKIHLYGEVRKIWLLRVIIARGKYLYCATCTFVVAHHP